MTERCAMCGAEIPEGRQVCPNCERRVMSEEEKKFEYVLTLNSEQAREVMNTLEFMMRWKLKQPRLAVEYLPDRLDWKGDFDGSLKKRDAMIAALTEANNIAIPERENMYTLKDEQWHRIYNIFQVIRHAIQQAEYPDSKGVDSYPTFPSGGEPLPGIEWRKKGR